MADTRELFRALELAHYAERFRDRLFVVALPSGTAFETLLLDLKVLMGYHVQVALVTRDPDFTLDRVIALANKRGARFHLSLLTDLVLRPGDPPQADPDRFDFERIGAVLRQGRVPVLAYHGTSGAAVDGGPDATYALAAEVAVRLGAHKLFLTHPRAGELRARLPRSHVVAAELEGLPGRVGELEGMNLHALLAFVSAQLERGTPDVVLLEGVQGHLFQEVFTHDGAGVLINAARTATIRRAGYADITDIALLLRPEVEAERILPIDENDIERAIADYLVYEIDGLLVGLARLKRFDNEAELAQFATLPRYRGKGRARELALRLIQEARDQGFRAVFALSLDQRMWAFFEGLGFQPVAREALPEAWQARYDMSRPSRAFRKEL